MKGIINEGDKQGGESVEYFSISDSRKNNLLEDTNAMSHDENSREENVRYGQKDIELTRNTSEAPVWNILPSYHMYKSTVYKSLNVSEENIVDPPTYENSPMSSNAPTLSLSNQVSYSAPTSVSNDSGSWVTLLDTSDQRYIVADESTNLWQETVLDNVHKLTNLTDSGMAISENVKISIEFTKDVGELNKKPVFIDPRLHEYKQGDFINGNVVIVNESNETIPFEMFYVLFEGNFIIANTNDNGDKNPTKVKKFLEMFDFSASWNDGHINRLITEFENPYTCPLVIDHTDNTNLAFGPERKLLPGVKYKRFFTFKIPENLLDSECSNHNLLYHTEIPPSMGVSRTEKLLRQHEHEHGIGDIKDLSFVDSSISYGVQARFIGRGSKYHIDNSMRKNKDTTLINSKGDEYVILKEANYFIRIVQQARKLNPGEKKINTKASELIYDNLVSRVKEKIGIGQDLLKSIEAEDFNTTIELADRFTAQASSDSTNQKLRQLYRGHCNSICKGEDDCEKVVENYNLVVPFDKKTIIGTKHMGTLQVSTPKITYGLKYIPPPKFRMDSHLQEEDINTWKIRVPIDLSYYVPQFSNEKSRKLPSIKSVSCDLVVLTMKSDEYPIPIEIIPDMLFKNKFADQKKSDNNAHQDLDNFSTIVKDEFKQFSTQFHNLIKKVPTDTFRIEAQLVQDIKSICNIQEKHMNLEIDDLKYVVAGQQPQTVTPKNLSKLEWSHQNMGMSASSDSNQVEYSSKFDLLVSLDSAHLKTTGNAKCHKTFDNVSLLPSFQSCSMGRFYYVKIVMGLSNNEMIRLKVPVTIEK